MFKIYKFLCIWLCVSSFLSATDSTIQFENLIGKPPTKACWLAKRFKESLSGQKNLLLLYGPPGNGKTTLARKIAEYVNGVFLAQSGPRVVNEYVGSGAKNISQLFEDAYRLSDENQKTIIFIDEIDAIASNIKLDSRAEYKSALQQLWLELDKCKNDPNIFVIFATNHFDKLDTTFLDRMGGNSIEIKNPDVATRKKVLEHYFKNANISLDTVPLETLVTKTNDLSIRCLEDLVADIHMATELSTGKKVTDAMVWQALSDTKTKFDKNKTSDEVNEKWWHLTSSKVAAITGSAGLTLNLIYFAAWLAGISGPRMA